MKGAAPMRGITPIRKFDGTICIIPIDDSQANRGPAAPGNSPTTSFTDRVYSLHCSSLRADFSESSPAFFAGKQMSIKRKLSSENKMRNGQLIPTAKPHSYPVFSSQAQKSFRDKATRNVVTSRVEHNPPIRFFSAYEEKVLQAVIDRLIPQDDRVPGKQIEILPSIDERLDKNALYGFRYEDMLPDRDAYCDGLRAIDEMARERFDTPFADLDLHSQELILQSLHDEAPDPPHEVWKRMPVHRFWNMLMEDCSNADPWAWDEIRFGGPAYLRGTMRLEPRIRCDLSLPYAHFKGNRIG
jgi:hypothetical protein